MHEESIRILEYAKTNCHNYSNLLWFNDFDYKLFPQIIEETTKNLICYPSLNYHYSAIAFFNISSDTLFMYNWDFTGFATPDYSEFVQKLSALAEDKFQLYEFRKYEDMYYATFIKTKKE